MRKRIRVTGAVLLCGAAILIGSARMLAQESGDPPALSDLFAQAESLWQEGQRNAAITTLRDIIVRSSEDPALAARAQLRMGQFLLNWGQYDSAEEALTAGKARV